MIELAADEESYLLHAFHDSPGEWFRPRSVAPGLFAGAQTDRIVESLARRGLLDAQPDCHARLTNRGRKEARRLDRFAQRRERGPQRRPTLLSRVLLCFSRMLPANWRPR